MAVIELRKLWLVLFAVSIQLIIPSLGGGGKLSASTVDDNEEPLAEKEYDPTASLTQVQIKEIYTPSEYGTNAQPNTLQFRPIIALDPSGFIPLPQLTRPTMRVVTVPNGKGASTSTAYDDMELLDLLVMPWPNSHETRFRWGLGPYFIFPTATNERTGQGAWQMGPGWAFSYRRIPGLNIASLFQQATSFAYTSSRSSPTSSLKYQPILTYQLGHQWYLKSSDATWTINFRHNTSTTIPLSAGFGKVWPIADGYDIDFFLSGEWMVYRQFAPQPEQFTRNFQLTFLFPKTKF